MATPIFETKSRLSRSLGLDLRNRIIRETPPDGFLLFGQKLIPLFAQGENTQVSKPSTSTTTKE